MSKRTGRLLLARRSSGRAKVRPADPLHRLALGATRSAKQTNIRTQSVLAPVGATLGGIGAIMGNLRPALDGPRAPQEGPKRSHDGRRELHEVPIESPRGPQEVLRTVRQSEPLFPRVVWTSLRIIRIQQQSAARGRLVSSEVEEHQVAAFCSLRNS